MNLTIFVFLLSFIQCSNAQTRHTVTYFTHCDLSSGNLASGYVYNRGPEFNIYPDSGFYFFDEGDNYLGSSSSLNTTQLIPVGKKIKVAESTPPQMATHCTFAVKLLTP